MLLSRCTIHEKSNETIFSAIGFEVGKNCVRQKIADITTNQERHYFVVIQKYSSHLHNQACLPGHISVPPIGLLKTQSQRVSTITPDSPRAFMPWPSHMVEVRSDIRTPPPTFRMERTST